MLTINEIYNHLNNLTKPPESLGRLEELAAKLCLCQQTLKPQTRPRQIVLFAADHGVVEEGVSAWPAEVTELMIDNILSGGAASSVLAKTTQTQLKLVDVGSLCQNKKDSKFYRCVQIAKGTANLAKVPAMTKEQFEKAVQIGKEEAENAVKNRAKILAAGEMGIGNTTAASCLSVLLCDVPVENVIGPGAGADDKILSRKIQVVCSAIKRIRTQSNGNLAEDIASVCGFEIAAMAGFYIKAAELKTVMVIDGFISTAAALIAEVLFKGSRDYMIASHCSAEPGHKVLLKKLQLKPLLDWSMRLGEGTGALLVMPLLDSAADVMAKMATFESAGIKQ
jgi:nicotinate-nucleotide--dimethylbenzimidazole phosphoribosyltransferase